jgi:hypothetical protein
MQQRNEGKEEEEVFISSPRPAAVVAYARRMAPFAFVINLTLRDFICMQIF